MPPSLAALIGLGAGAAAWPLARRHLASYRLQKRSLAEEVQWGLLATPRLVWNKDGALVAAWEFSGPDLSYATAHEADALARQAQRALGMLGHRYMLHVDSVRVPSRQHASGGHLPAPVGTLIDRARQRRYQSGTHYENRSFMALTFQPQKETRRRARSWLYTGGAEGETVHWQHETQEFEKRLRAFEDRLPPALGLRRLGEEDLLSYLRLTLTGMWQPVSRPDGPAFLDFLFSEPLQGGFEPKIGDRWHRVVSVQGYAKEAFVGVMEPLLKLPFPYRYNNRLIGVSRADARSLIRRRTGQWTMLSGDVWSLLLGGGEGAAQAGGDDERFKNQHADRLSRDASEAETKVLSGRARMFHHTAAVVVWAKRLKEANERARRVEKALRSAGFVAERERGLATEALIGTWPGHGQKNVRRYPLLSEYAARMLPLTSTYPGPEENPCSTYEEGAAPLFYASTPESVPFRFTPYVGEVGHQLIIGPTGSGKSILMAFQAMRQLQYAGGQAILLDAGNSFAPLCEALGGRRYDVAAAEGGRAAGFQPLAGIDDPEERRWALSWVLTLVKMQGVEVTPSLRRAVGRTLETMASPRRGADGGRSYRTLHELKTQVQSNAVKDALAPYCAGGPVGTLLDASEDAFEAARFQVLELSSLLELREEIYTPVLLYLFHRIEHLLGPRRPTYVGADEFFLFAARTEAGRSYAMEALRTYRKKNAMMTIASQAPTDVTGRAFAAVLSSVRTRIFLPNPDALDPEQRRGYESIGLSDAEIAAVAEAVPKKEYLSKQPGGTRKWDLGLRKELELAFMTAADGLSLAGTAEKMRAFKEDYGERWAAEWLAYRGYPEAAARAAGGFPSGDGAPGAAVRPASAVAP